jgi:hypothetical protein
MLCWKYTFTANIAVNCIVFIFFARCWSCWPDSHRCSPRVCFLNPISPHWPKFCLHSWLTSKCREKLDHSVTCITELYCYCILLHTVSQTFFLSFSSSTHNQLGCRFNMYKLNYVCISSYIMHTQHCNTEIFIGMPTTRDTGCLCVISNIHLNITNKKSLMGVKFYV